VIKIIIVKETVKYNKKVPRSLWAIYIHKWMICIQKITVMALPAQEINNEDAEDLASLGDI